MNDSANKPLTPFDLQLLQIAAKGENKPRWDWYDIAKRVVYAGVQGERAPVKALHELAEMGLIQIVQQEGHAYPDYRITDQGRDALTNSE